VTDTADEAVARPAAGEGQRRVGDHAAPGGDLALARVREENAFLYAVIGAISSSLEREQVLNNIVAILREATGCHAGFVYLVEDERLVLRAASAVHRHLVGRLSFGMDEGVCGWVARTGEPALIRENALADPRMKYVAELEEERFQSMVAVPIARRSGDVAGVVVLHTVAPREFDDAVVNFLVNAASLVAGAIENAELYRATRRRVDALTTLSRLAQALAAATRREELHDAVTRGARELTGADTCRLYRHEPVSGELELVAASPPEAAAPRRAEGTGLLFDVLGSGADIATEEEGGLLIAPVVAGDERLGVLCCRTRAPRRFGPGDAELLRSVAHQAAVGLARVDLIEGLTAESLVHGMFQALAEDAPEAATERATRVALDLGRPHAILQVERAPDATGAAEPWAALAGRVQGRLRTDFPAAVFHAGHERLRGLVPLLGVADGLGDLRLACSELAAAEGLVIGFTGVRRGAQEGTRSLREAADAARMARVLEHAGGALCYEDLGAYKYLVRFTADDVPRDALYRGVEQLLDYDVRRQTHLVDTLEQFLVNWRSIGASARALYIHPNTLRQRLNRIHSISGIDVDRVDPLSLELAVKLARLRASATRP
jgi:GAF domain-containing protein